MEAVTYEVVSPYVHGVRSVQDGILASRALDRLKLTTATTADGRSVSVFDAMRSCDAAAFDALDRLVQSVISLP